jgi:hypothetical protein
MKHTVYLILLVTGFLIKGNAGYSQQVIATAGGSYTSGAHSVSYTIGDAVIETVGDDIILTQGFQQSKLTVTGIYRYRLLQKEFTAFPNPVLYELSLSVNNEPEKYTITILSDVGQVLSNEEKMIGNEPTKIDFSDYKPGIYFVRIMKGKGLVLQTFKIVKI